mgnify:CR=1 FL=1
MTFALFSERYGYVKPSELIIRETITADVQNLLEKMKNIAEKDIPISNSTRLGLALNFSVFYYEIKGEKDKACDIARTAFDESMKVLDDLEKEVGTIKNEVADDYQSFIQLQCVNK